MSVPEEPSARSDATSSSLLELAARGEQRAAQAVWDLYRPLVLAWCHRQGLSTADAEDVSQEVFTVVFQKLPGFRRQRQGSFRTWVKQITQYKIWNLRERGATPGVGGTDFQEWIANRPLEPAEDAHESAADRTSLLRQAATVLQLEFSSAHWQAFYRAEIEQQEPARICADLGLSPGALRVVKSRVRKRLRELTADLLD